MINLLSFLVPLEIVVSFELIEMEHTGMIFLWNDQAALFQTSEIEKHKHKQSPKGMIKYIISIKVESGYFSLIITWVLST